MKWNLALGLDDSLQKKCPFLLDIKKASEVQRLFIRKR